ncbi:MAG TPA: tyrosine-type recombinase/integrase, partial [Lacipirellulaceae bacterium]|nr:tyrosine-type recombinase/integrase [Lacipirellulaceae bacterium]
MQDTPRKLYILAAWTGYRRKELASLTLKSLDLDGSPATVPVQAGDSKRRKNDVVPLHPAVVDRFKAWIATGGLCDCDQPL